MEYRKFSKEQRKDVLDNTLANLESQHYARSLDIEKWRAVKADPLTEAAAEDTRIINNRDQEATGELARALYDVRKLEIAMEHTQRELAALGNA